MFLIHVVIPEWASAPAPRASLTDDRGAWHFSQNRWVRDYPPTYQVQVISWDDTVPTAGNGLIIVGVDAADVLHARVFNLDGIQIVDQAESGMASPGRLKWLVKHAETPTPSLSDALWIAYWTRIVAHGGLPFDDLTSAGFRPRMIKSGSPIHASMFRLAADLDADYPSESSQLAARVFVSAGTPSIDMDAANQRLANPIRVAGFQPREGIRA